MWKDCSYFHSCDPLLHSSLSSHLAVLQMHRACSLLNFFTPALPAARNSHFWFPHGSFPHFILFLCFFPITSLVRLFLTILLKIGGIFIFFPFTLLYFLLSMCIPNIILYICFHNCLSPTRVLAPWELGLCLFHCCFLSNQSNAHSKHSVFIECINSGTWSVHSRGIGKEGREMVCAIYQNISR